MERPAQTLLVVQEGRGKVVVLSANDPTQRTEIVVGDKPHEIEVTPDGLTAFVSNFGLLEANYKVGTPGTTLSVIDIDHRRERARYHLPEGYTAPHGLKLRPPRHRELFTNTEIGKEAMVVFDAASGDIARTFPLPPGVHNFLFNADGSVLFAFTPKGEVLSLDAESGKLLGRATTGSPRGLAWTSDSHDLIVSGRNEILFLHPATLSIERRIADLGVGQVFYPQATPDGRFILAPAVLDGVVLVIDVKTGEVSHRIPTGSPLLFILSRDGRHAWISNVLVPAAMLGPNGVGREGGVTRLDLTTFSVTPIPGTPDANGLAVVG
jgi:DNA-binding beta-propeller fold protein YncE